MTSLIKRDGFVASNVVSKGVRKGRKRDSTRTTVPLVLLIITGLLLVSVISATTAMNGAGKQSEGITFSRGVVENDFGNGYKNPQVITAPNVFVVATVYYGALTISFIDASTGNLASYSPMQFINDVNSYYFRIAYDSSNDKLMILWINETQVLNYTFVTGIGSGSPSYVGNNYTLDTSAQNTGVGLASDNNGHFLAVWSRTDNHNYFAFIDSSDYSHNTPVLVSDDTHSHAQNFAAYDPNSSHYMIVWRNYSGLTGKYNITGKIIDGTGSTVVNDFTIANGVADNAKYDYPAVEGGFDVFAVAYVNYNSPYDVHLVLYDAAGGHYIASQNLGNSAKYGVSYPGIAFNGSGFVVAWTNDSYDIVANNFALDGTPAFSTPKVIAGTSHTEEWQDVAYHPDTQAYYFVWYDYTDKHDHGSYWTESEFVPELSAFLPVMAVAIVGIILLRKRH